jgi:hypothetical protein
MSKTAVVLVTEALCKTSIWRKPKKASFWTSRQRHDPESILTLNIQNGSSIISLSPKFQNDEWIPDHLRRARPE